MSILVRPTNGVSYGTKYTITSADATAGFVLFDFRKNGVGTYRFDLVTDITWRSSVGAVLANTGLTITYPLAGQIRVAGTLVAGQILDVVAQAVKDTETYSA